MSPCENYQELISRMLDGELSAREEADLAEHIESCPACAALFRAFSAVSQQIGGDLEDAPRNLRDNVMAQVRREEIRKKNRIPTVFRIVMSAAAMIAVAVGVYLGVSLTKNAALSAAAYKEAPQAAEERFVLAADSSAAEEPEWEEALEAEEAPALQSVEMPAEEPAPAAGIAANDAAAVTAEEEGEPDRASEYAGLEEKAETPTWDFSHWDLALFRELLGGEESDLTREELEPSLIGCALVRSGSELAEFRLYVWADDLYYYDPVRKAVFLAELSCEEWTEFLG